MQPTYHDGSKRSEWHELSAISQLSWNRNPKIRINKKIETTKKSLKQLIYVASRASIPERPAMWRTLRDQGMPISSTWIDEAEQGETDSFSDLWHRIEFEIRNSRGLILYAERDDFPLKGALIEVGMALGMGKPVAVVLPGDEFLEARSLRPVGSWLHHSKCEIFKDVNSAVNWIYT